MIFIVNSESTSLKKETHEKLCEFRRTNFAPFGSRETCAMQTLVQDTSVVSFEPQYLDAIASRVDEYKESTALWILGPDLARPATHNPKLVFVARFDAGFHYPH